MRFLLELGRDLRHALRTIGRMPGLAAVVILSLGIGIGANTVVFSWIQMLIRKPLPGVRDVGRFYLVEPRDETGSHPGVAWAEYEDLRQRLRTFEGLLASRMIPLDLGEPGRAERTYGQLVSASYFPLLGLTPFRGRFLTPDEVSRPGGAPVAVVSHGFWRARLGGAPDALGKTLLVNGIELTVVGVAPEGFQGSHLGLTFDLWVPATLAPALFPGSRELTDRTQRGWTVMGRLAPGITLADAAAELAGAMRELERDYPPSNAGLGADLLTFWQALRGPPRFLLGALRILQGIMLLLLLAVCANTANLLLARASARQREIGVRGALGAGRGRLVSLLLTESLVLALGGVALGVALAVWGTDAIRAVPMIGAFPIRFQTGVDGVTLLFASLLGLGCGLLFGAAPAVQLARVDPLAALRSGTTGGSRSRLRNVLMGVEVALALAVLVSAGIFLRSFGETRDLDPGFRRDGVLLAAYEFGDRRPDDDYSRTFAATLLERLGALPDVEAAALSTAVPLDIHGLPRRGFELEGHARDEVGRDQALLNVVTPGYFRTLDIPILSGRDFAGLSDPSPQPQAVVNDAFVARFLPGAEPLGRRITAGGDTYVIAGVVRTSTYDTFGEDPQPIIYYSYRDLPYPRGQIHVRIRPGAETAIVPELRRVVAGIDPTLPLYDVRTMTEHIDKNLFLRRIPARMFAVLGPLLLALAAIGIYAVVSYTVSRRTAEIGVRIALGATAGTVTRQIVRESLRIAVIGAGAGWLLVYMVYIHVARGRPLDPLVFAGIPALLLLVAAVASWLPARRVASVDPIETLRQE
ncbi:MAG TPA: ABC transporter permease [Gemmatimonadales bacterium]|nr:ABC transporter permease [Gemmatimonadales bacterium]